MKRSHEVGPDDVSAAQAVFALLLLASVEAGRGLFWLALLSLPFLALYALLLQ